MIPSIPPASPPVGLADPAALVAALPVLLGFRPRDSLVLAALCAGEGGRMRLGLTLRVDLPPPRDVDALCSAAANSLLLGDPDAAAVVVVGGSGPSKRSRRRGSPAARDAAGLPRRDVAAAVVEALRARGVPAHTVVWAQRCAGGARWACYDECGCGGLVPDPGGTELAARAVTEGQVVYEDREELERLVAPASGAVLRRREALLERSLDAANAGAGAAEALRGDDVAAALARVDRAVAEAADGWLTLDDTAIVSLARALTLPDVRDAALCHCAGPRAAAAEQLWAALARETPDPEAAVPAAMLAVSALLRGRGALANIALDRAERAWPGHRLTMLLRDAADAGVRPDEVRSWLAGC
jgi:hypothetical protein